MGELIIASVIGGVIGSAVGVAAVIVHEWVEDRRTRTALDRYRSGKLGGDGR